MMRKLRKHEADGVLVHKIDRGARNLRDWADVGDLIDAGFEVYFVNENLDMKTRGGRLSADIQAVVAADFIRNLREETRKGFYGRLKQGFLPLPAPIGYLDQGKAKPKILDPERAPLVRQAFELYATAEYSLERLLEQLRSRGLTNRRGGTLSLSSLSVLLNNPFYMGLCGSRKPANSSQGTMNRW
jgi:site-specific DNA recombinase